MESSESSGFSSSSSSEIDYFCQHGAGQKCEIYKGQGDVAVYFGKDAEPGCTAVCKISSPCCPSKGYEANGLKGCPGVLANVCAKQGDSPYDDQATCDKECQ
jgi:hypothetical protein